MSIVYSVERKTKPARSVVSYRYSGNDHRSWLERRIASPFLPHLPVPADAAEERRYFELNVWSQIALRAIAPLSLYGTAERMRRCVSTPVHFAH